jgi:hypothetical protein
MEYLDTAWARVWLDTIVRVGIWAYFLEGESIVGCMKVVIYFLVVGCIQVEIDV